MKKKLLFIIILLIPITALAKEYCTVISGTGHNLGDEIACGTEHFLCIK